MKTICLDNIKTSYFDTRDIVLKQRNDYWQDAISQVFVPLDSQTESSESFWGRLESRTCSDLTIVRVQGASQHVKRCRQKIRKTPKDLVLMSFMLKGKMGLDYYQKQITLKEKQFVFYDTDQEYNLNLDTTFDQIVVAIPKARFEANFGTSKDLYGYSFGENHPLQQFYEHCLQDIFTTNQLFTEPQQCMIEEHLFHLMTHMVADQYPVKTSYLFNDIKQYMTANHIDPQLNIHEVAQAFRISTRYISKLFQKEDMTFGQFLLAERLRHAKQLLQITSKEMYAVKQVAYDTGFNDLSYFSREFKKLYGLTPSEVRPLNT
ncbi:AraC family transcriptional regulator [Acinetobacter pollinis]|uniref:AraC family transcriptional regulator n=1 Tax=Acinetobacter pollinis TaxID=2605270 RepID=A0ABU6DV68_9GAMM|nr:AraC family transcriptional regulator [Acinetobacter pollinis]MEB5477019.1 AraC family transcriptional regulator [Acinetobacter pollinis]